MAASVGALSIQRNISKEGRNLFKFYHFNVYLIESLQKKRFEKHLRMAASVLVSVTKFSLRLDALTFCTEFRTKCFYLTSSNLMISTFKNSLKDILSRNVSVDADFSVAIYYSRVKEVVVRRCPVKKMFLNISQNSQENACAEDPGTGVCL